MDFKGKRIALTTSNGTRALSMIDCEIVYAASFLNFSSIVEILKRFDEIDIICSGTNGEFSLEDFLLAGFIAKEIDIEKNDAAVAAERYASSVKNVLDEILKSSHAKKLIDLGFEDDVEFCSQIDIYDTVPILKDGEFVRG